MNAKDLKFLELFESFAKIDFLTDKTGQMKAMRAFMELDYSLAVDIWDYTVSTREGKLSADERFCEATGFELLNQFSARAPDKCKKAVSETPSIRRAVYQYSKHAGEENALLILIELLIGSKLPAAEEIFKCMLKNERIHYGKTMETVLKRVFIELLKKNPMRIEMSKKLYELLQIGRAHV
jgi:hypothetical protein